MAPQNPVPPPPPLSTYRPSFERAPLGSGPRKGPRPQPPRRRGGLLLGVVYFFLFVILVAGGGVAYLLVNPPSALIRQKISEQVKARTGRDLIVAGPANFTFFPVLGVSLKDVSLSGPPGMDGKLVDMQALDVSVKAMTLLSRQVEINSIVLRKPIFEFRVDKSRSQQLGFCGARCAGAVRRGASRRIEARHRTGRRCRRRWRPRIDKSRVLESGAVKIARLKRFAA